MIADVGGGLSARLYHRLIDSGDGRGPATPDGSGGADPSVAGVALDVRDAVPDNAMRIVVALTLQKIGDRIADPKSVLAWLLSAVGAPAAFTALLVPVREAGALLPQSALVPRVRLVRRRSRAWAAASVGQGLVVGVIALSALWLRGAAAGAAVVGALAVFALCRSLASITSTDVMGRTIPKGERGQVSGLASVTSGVVAIAVGLGLRTLGADAGVAVLAGLLGGAASLWLAAAAVFTMVEEPTDEEGAGDRQRDTAQTDAGTDDAGTDDAGPSLVGAGAVALLRGDVTFRRFVVARSLLLVSALSPPFVVALANEEGDAALAGLGVFVIAQGVASMVGGRLWGRLADRSSRLAMMAAAGSASTVIVVFLAADPVLETGLRFPVAYLLLAIAHEGARLGRKTYVTDMAGGDLRTTYVAGSNTAMGVVLLVAGGVSAVLAVAGPRVALAFLAAAGLAGVLVGRELPEVSAGGATDPAAQT